ncbi:MAG TPA: TadE family protein, partial [Anaerolineaceae bacterium]|nr:TadE family protein [Anaerolineaceae bacterium]
LMEMAVSMVAIVILLAGIVDLGRAIFTFMALRDAAQEGLVYASVYPFPCNRINQRIDDTLDNTPISYKQIDYFYEGAYHGCDYAAIGKVITGSEMRVTVAQTDFPITMPFLGAILGRQTIEIKAVVNGSVIRHNSVSP